MREIPKNHIVRFEVSRAVLSKEQKRVYKWLESDLSLPVFAEAYKGAVELIETENPGYVSFAAHTGRDLMNGLAATVKGLKRERVNYQEHIDRLQDDWQDEWRLSDDLSREVLEEGHRIPIEVCRKISYLIDEHEAGRRRSSDSDDLFFSTFLDYSDKEKVPKNLLKEWKAAKAWFMKHAHLREKPFKPGVGEELAEHFNCLDGYLQIAAGSQYDRLRELNEILDATNG